MSKTVLAVSKLRKVFPPQKKGEGEFVAVDEVSFRLQEGQILGLLGPNGAGKSTTISMLLGVLTPSSGSIRYFGKELAAHQSEILQQVTFASTYIRLPWRLTVLENLRVYGYLYGLSSSEFYTRAKKFLEFFGVWEQRDKTIGELSAGQVTRVMLAKAFIPHPRVALLDEPTASLDPDIAHEVRSFVKAQQQEYGTSILYTSHNMDEVSDVCESVMFLKQGKIVAHDTPANLSRQVSTSRIVMRITKGAQKLTTYCKASSLALSKLSSGESEVVIDEHQISEFFVAITQLGIDYSSIEIHKPTLEDYFLKMAGVKHA